MARTSQSPYLIRYFTPSIRYLPWVHLSSPWVAPAIKIVCSSMLLTVPLYPVAAFLQPDHPDPCSLLIRKGVLYYPGKVGVAHEFGELPHLAEVLRQVPGAERAPEVVVRSRSTFGLHILALASSCE